MANSAFPNISSFNTVSFTPLNKVLTTGRVLIVGQSNQIPTNKEFYANIQLWDRALIENTFGKGQEMTMKLLDALTITNQSPLYEYKPIIDAICYKDITGSPTSWGDAIYWIDVAGTSAVDGSIKIVFNKNNASRLDAEIITRFAMMKHLNANVSGIALDGTLLGTPSNISKPFHQKYNTSYENDSFITISIAKNTSAANVASQISSAINNAISVPFTSTVTGAKIILTPKNKGAAVNDYNIQEASNTTNKSITLACTRNTAVDTDHVPDLTDFFTTPVDNNGTTINTIKYDFYCFPNGYLEKSANFTVITNTLKDKYNSAPQNNVTDGHVVIVKAIDTSSNTEINNLATKFPIDESVNTNKNANVSVIVLKRNALANQAVTSPLEINNLASKKFSYCSIADGFLQQATIYTLKAEGDFQDELINKLVNRYQRLFTAIALLQGDLLEKNYTTNADVLNVNNYINKEIVIEIFNRINIALTTGNVSDELYGTTFTGILDNNEKINELFITTLNNTIAFDKAAKTLSVTTYNKYPNALEAVMINNSYTY